MKRHLLTLILSGFLGSLVLAGNAEACHKKKCGGCAPAPAPCVVVAEPCPPPPPVVCEPAPTCAPKKKCGLFAGLKGMKLGCHKKKAVACAEPCPAPAPAPCGEVVAYSAPVSYSAPVIYAAPQASAQH